MIIYTRMIIIISRANFVTIYKTTIYKCHDPTEIRTFAKAMRKPFHYLHYLTNSVFFRNNAKILQLFSIQELLYLIMLLRFKPIHYH